MIYPVIILKDGVKKASYPTMEKPSISSSKYWTHNGTKPDFELLRVANELYKDHLQSLETFDLHESLQHLEPGTELTNVRKQWQRSIYASSLNVNLDWRDCTEEQFNRERIPLYDYRIILCPVLPVDDKGNVIVGQFKFDHEKGEETYTSFLPERPVEEKKDPRDPPKPATMISPEYCPRCSPDTYSVGMGVNRRYKIRCRQCGGVWDWKHLTGYVFLEDKKGEEKKDGAYEIYCTNFSKIIHASSLYEAVKIFGVTEPNETIIFAEDTGYAKLERESHPSMKEALEKIANVNLVQLSKDGWLEAAHQLHDIARKALL